MEQGVCDQVPRASGHGNTVEQLPRRQGQPGDAGLAVQTGSGRRVVQAHARRLDVLFAAHRHQAPGSGHHRHPHPAPGPRLRPRTGRAADPRHGDQRTHRLRPTGAPDGGHGRGLWGTRCPHPARTHARIQGAAGPVDLLHRGARGQENAGLETDVRDPDPVGARGRSSFRKGGCRLRGQRGSVCRGQETPHRQRHGPRGAFDQQPPAHPATEPGKARAAQDHGTGHQQSETRAPRCGSPSGPALCPRRNGLVGGEGLRSSKWGRPQRLDGGLRVRQV